MSGNKQKLQHGNPTCIESHDPAWGSKWRVVVQGGCVGGVVYNSYSVYYTVGLIKNKSEVLRVC